MIQRSFHSLSYALMNYRNFSLLSRVTSDCILTHKFLKYGLLPVRTRFFEPWPGGIEYPPPPSEHSLTDHFHRGRKMILGECKMWLDEITEKFRQDPKIYQHGDTEVIFRFNTEDSLEKWAVSSDRENKEGNSEAHFVHSNNGKALFYGNIDTNVVKDGKAKRTGFASLKSKRLKKSFQRANCYEWEVFTHLELRVRGDGRTYSILLGMGHSLDLLWLDIYTYALFTRGGPYWETIRIPFSKFYLTSKGRVQDQQERIHLDRVNTVGIQCCQIPGPFKLEIDYIGVHCDLRERENCAYELYKFPKYLVSGD